MQIDATPNNQCRLPCRACLERPSGHFPAQKCWTMHFHGLGFNEDSHNGPKSIFHNVSSGFIRLQQTSSDFIRLHQTYQASDFPSIRHPHLRDRQLRGIPPPAWCTLHPGRLPHASRICDLSLVGTYWTHQDRHDSKTKANLVAGLSGLSCKLPERVTVQMAINWINCVILPSLTALVVPHASHNNENDSKSPKTRKTSSSTSSIVYLKHKFEGIGIGLFFLSKMTTTMPSCTGPNLRERSFAWWHSRRQCTGPET